MIRTKQRLGARLKRRPSFSTSGSPGSPRASLAAGAATAGLPSPSNAGQVSVATELAPWVPTAGDPFDAAKAAHLMRRAGFGASPEDIEAILRIGHARTVDLLVIPSTSELQDYGTQMLPSGELLNLHSSVADQRAQWIHEMVTTRFPLKEKMALFWHDHFSVGANSSTDTPMLPPHINVFRRHGLGRFRDIVVGVTRDPAMLRWLDNRINGAGGKINENYGRELLELYTMGVDNGYTQKDVEEASKCLAGWSLYNYNVFRYNTNYARAGAGWKTVLGKGIWSANQEREGYILIDHILAQRQTAEYIVSKIWSYFVDERPQDPGPAQDLWDGIIVELARRWSWSGHNVRGLMWMILSSHYFYTTAPRKLIKNPAETMVGAIRNLGAPPILRYAQLGARMEFMGLPLLRYTNPAGLDDGIAWVNSQSVIARSNFFDELTQFSTTADFRVHWDPLAEIQRQNATSATQIVDLYLRILVDDAAPAAVRQTLYDFMDLYDASPAPVRVPFDGLRAADPRRDRKIRGLVQLVMSLPEYQIN